MTENLLICRILFFAALAASMAVALPVQSQAPCDFKGIAVGDKMTREQLMQRLGIVNFKLDPPRPDFMEMHEQIEQYGITGAAEREDDKIGPYCREDYCNIPWGLHVGDDNIGVKLFVSLRKYTVTEIEVFFNSLFWNEIWEIIVHKYGSSWDIERSALHPMGNDTGIHQLG